MIARIRRRAFALAAKPRASSSASPSSWRSEVSASTRSRSGRSRRSRCTLPVIGSVSRYQPYSSASARHVRSSRLAIASAAPGSGGGCSSGRGGLVGARLGPDVDAEVHGVLIDRLELVVREVEPVERPEVVVELLDAACADERGCDAL